MRPQVACLVGRTITGQEIDRTRREGKLMVRKLAVVVAAAAIALVAAGCVTTQDTLSAINADRASAGAAAVQEAGDLDYVAQNWANYLRDTNSFYHQDIAALQAWSPYSAMGET